MRNLKKVLALVLALVMTMSLVTIANAADFSDADDIQYTEAVDVLTALGVIDGVGNNTFRPEGNVTRAQMAKMITIVALGDVEPSAFLGTKTDLKDINGHWAEAYIKYCYSQGIISGRGNGIFDPDDNVTAAEASKMLLTAIGYNSKVQGYTGAQWTINVARDAQTSGFYEDLTVPANQDLTRDQAAQLIYNAVQADLIVATPNWNASTGTVTYTYEKNDKNKTLLTETFEAKTFVGTFNGNYNTGDAAKGEVEIYGRLNSESSVAGTPNYAAARAADFPSDLSISNIGEQFKVIFKDGTGGSNNQPDKNDTIYGVFNTGATTVYTITKGDLQDAGAANLAKGKIKFNDTLYDVYAFAADTDVAIVTNYGNVADVTAATVDAANGESGTGCSAIDFATYINTSLRVNSADTIKFVCNDEGKICRAYVESWTYSKVLSKTSDKVQLEGVGSRDLADVNFINDASVDSLVAVADFYSGVQQTQVKSAQTVSGTVTAIRGTSEIQIDGVWYDKSVNAEGLTDYSNLTYAVGDTYELVLDGSYYVAGKVISADSDYAIVLKASQGINDQVKLLLADGTEATYIINSESAIQYGSTVNTTTIDSSMSLANAVLVKYELLKNDTEVKMSAVTFANDTDGSNDHTFNKDTKVLTVYGAAKVGDYVVDSNAVAFVYNSTTGKWKSFDANTISSITATASTAAYYVVKSGKVVAFALTDTAFPTGSGTSTGYGYVTDVISTKVNDSNVVQLSVWNGTETVTVTVDGTSAPAAKGDFVKYPVSTAAVAYSEVIKANDGTSYFYSTKVKEYDASRNLLITTTGAYSVTGDIVDDSESVYTVNADTKIIGVKTADKKGSSYNAITPFTKVSGQDYNNAYIIYENDNGTNVVKAIFVDEDNAITTYPAGIATKTGAAGTTRYTVATPTISGVSGTAAATYPAANFSVTVNKAQGIDNEVLTFTITYNGTVTDTNDTFTFTPSATGADGAVVTTATGIAPGKTWTCTMTINASNVTAATVAISATANA